jgi:hypothetical protein
MRMRTSARIVANIRTDDQHEHMRVRHAQGVSHSRYVDSDVIGS